MIVSDVMMPEMDGIEFCKYVKGHLEMSHIPMCLSRFSRNVIITHFGRIRYI